MMKKLKKPYKILLFLSIGLLVFFLFWRASGYVGITPIMAMRQLEREHLVNDTKVILSEDVPTEIGSAIYRNVLTMNDEYLYYCEMSGDHILYWGTYFGRWHPSSPLRYSPRTTPITHILGNWQAQHYDEIKYAFSIPLFILPEDETLVWDEAHATLDFDFRNEVPEWNCLFRYTAQAERSTSGLTKLFFRENTHQIIDGTPTGKASALRIWEYLFRNQGTKTPITLTITLYDNGTQVHTESHDLSGGR